ncbi:MAG TPA: amino acid adenylation domain-containing protein, partial [Blastocatellia bacterium]|nr:amino acid adenylation domain-containing protein [Blastocatellia bacterium]
FQDDLKTPVAFDTGPLLRLALFCLSANEHVLLVSVASICADADTARVMAKEVSQSYAACSEGREPDGEVLQYCQYSTWQNELLASDDMEEGRVFWSRRNAFPLTELSPAFAKKSPAARSFCPSRVSLKAGPQVAEELDRAVESFDTSPPAFLLACFQVLLFRFTDQSQISVGCATDGRKYAEMESMPGLFNKYLPAQGSLAAGLPFKELLKKTEESMSEMYEWQEGFVFDQDSTGPKYFPICFAYQDTSAVFSAGDISVSVGRSYDCIDRFDLRLACLRKRDGLTIAFDFDMAVYDSQDLLRFASHFQTLLKSALSNPESPIDELNILSDEERHEVLVKFNDTFVGHYNDEFVHNLFDKNALSRPDRIAVEYGESRLTYGELYVRSNQLARYLQGVGVGPEVVVAVLMEHSPEMIVAIMGILKAGGAYLPLDPIYPQERMIYMLRDANVELLLTHERLRARLPECEIRGVFIDSAWDEISSQGSEAPGAELIHSNLAYVIYTSGSTGKPKGTMVSHGGLSNYLAWSDKAYATAEGEGALLHSSIAFDLSVTSLFGPLIAGRKIVLADSAKGIESLVTALRQHKNFSFVKVTPAHARAVAQELYAEEAAGRARVLIVGGENLPAQDIAFWQNYAPDTIIINEYGPTETVVGCCVYQAKPQEQDTVPIGRPISNTQIYLLDSHLYPVPIWCTGELYVGGAGLARGYLNRPDLTSDRFTPDPFGAEPGGRLYRTGDLARRLPDGNLECLGRVDHQVKIHGYRIELAEIEATLCQHRCVREAVASVHQDQRGNRQIAAYIVAATDEPVSEADLRGFLHDLLPRYMIPSGFIFMPALPLTPNGKVDRGALPPPDRKQAVFVAPRNFTEELLASIWAEVLRLQRVSIDDNFFSVGGDSIRSIQLRTRSKQRGLNISHQQIFQFQTIREMAKHVNFQSPADLQPLTTEPFGLVSHGDRMKMPEDVEDAYPLSMLQAGMLFHSELDAQSGMYRDFHSFHLQGRFDLQSLTSAIGEVVNRHAVLRTSFDLGGYSQPLQLVHKQVDLPLVVHDLTEVAAERQQAMINAAAEAEKNRPYDYRSAPLLRFIVYKRAGDRFQLTLGFHHAILDGWSVATMLTEILQQYVMLLSGEKKSAAGLAATFRDFVAMEMRVVESDEARRYWSRQLDDSTVITLPRLSSEPLTPLPRAESLTVPISEELSEGLKQLARSLSVPVKSVLLAAHMKVMSLLSGQEDVLTGLVTNGRPEYEDGDKVLGLFLNTVPLRLRLTGGTWADLVRESFEAERELLPFRRYPLAQIQRSRGGQPLFDTDFNFMHYHVYEALANVGDVQLLNYTGYERTNITLTANFYLDVSSLQVKLSLTYHAEILSKRQMEVIAGYYSRALSLMAGDPSARHGYVSLMSGQERRQILEEWNDTRKDYRTDVHVHQLFEAQAERTPHAIAVVYEDHRLTYRQLNGRANQLAHFLREQGAGPETLVGVCMERSIEMVVGLLAILKAGAAYVPLDPAYPKHRLTFMTEDAAAAVMLTQRRFAGMLGAQARNVVCLDDEWERLSRYSEDNPRCTVAADNLVYVIYTSGSTGRPKGAMNTHRGISNRLQWMQEAYRLTDQDGVLQKTPFSFDVSVWEFFWPLMAGARLVVARPGGHQDGQYLVEVMARQQVTTAHFVPSMLRVFLEEEGLERCASVRQVMSSGEALTKELVKRYKERMPGKLHNLYGPTEAAVDVTSWECEIEEQQGLVPIGRPIGNTAIYVVNE